MTVESFYFELLEMMPLPLSSTEVPECDFCGLNGEMFLVYEDVDCLSAFGGGLSNLCQFCDEINRLFWDFADVKNNIGLRQTNHIDIDEINSLLSDLADVKNKIGFYEIGYVDVDSGENIYQVYQTWLEANERVRTLQNNAIPAWHSSDN